MERSKANVPKIRFPGFTDAWELRKLGDEFEKINERNDGSFGRENWISVAKMYFQDPEKVQSNNIDTRTYVMREGDIAFEGHQNAEYEFGRFVANDIGAGVVSELFPIYRHRGVYDNNYWKEAIKLERIMAPIFSRSIAASGNSSNKLDSKHFLRQKIYVPEIEEQRKIGIFFDNINHLITLHQRKLTHLQAQKKGLLQKMFPTDGEQFPELRFPGFTGAWDVRKLGEIATDTYGGGTPKTSNTKYWDGCIPWIQSSDLIEHKLYGIVPRKYISECGLQNSATKLVPENSIAIVTRVGVGKLAFLPFSYATSQDFLSLSNLKIDTCFSVYAIYNKLQKELNTVQGTSIKGITKGELLFKDISVPENSEQKKIGQFFYNIDNLITLHQRKLTHLQQQKKALLQQMFV